MRACVLPWMISVMKNIYCASLFCNYYFIEWPIGYIEYSCTMCMTQMQIFRVKCWHARTDIYICTHNAHEEIQPSTYENQPVQKER